MGLKEIAYSELMQKDYLFASNLGHKYDLVTGIDIVIAKSSYMEEIKEISYEAYLDQRNLDKGKLCALEFVVVEFVGGAKCIASNSANSLSATYRAIGNLLDGGRYELVDFYNEKLRTGEIGPQINFLA